MPEAIEGLDESHPQEKEDQGLNPPPRVHGIYQHEEQNCRRPEEEGFPDRGITVQRKGDQGAQTIGVPQRPDLYGLGREPPHHTLGQGHKLEPHQERRCQY